MTKWLGLDVGDKRVGVSLSDPSRLLASPLGVFDRAAGEAEQRILKLVEDQGISRIVVGMPFSEDGTENMQCRKIMAFCRRLAKRTPVEISFIDEYGSSCESQERLAEARGAGSAAGRANLDAAAACLILQQAMDLCNGQTGAE